MDDDAVARGCPVSLAGCRAAPAPKDAVQRPSRTTRFPRRRPAATASSAVRDVPRAAGPRRRAKRLQPRPAPAGFPGVTREAARRRPPQGHRGRDGGPGPLAALSAVGPIAGPRRSGCAPGVARGGRPAPGGRVGRIAAGPTRRRASGVPPDSPVAVTSMSHTRVGGCRWARNIQLGGATHIVKTTYALDVEGASRRLARCWSASKSEALRRHPCRLGGAARRGSLLLQALDRTAVAGRPCSAPPACVGHTRGAPLVPAGIGAQPVIHLDTSPPALVAGHARTAAAGGQPERRWG
jgi:hypothetical protein